MDLVLKPKRLGNILLREIEESDYLDYFEIGKDPLVCKYLNWGPFIKPQEALWTIKEIFLKRPEVDNLPKGYAIIKDNHMIGMIDFHTHNLKQNSIEIGYFLKREFWGMGIMKRACTYMVSYAFSMGFDKVCIGSVSENERSVQLIKSLGFKYEYNKLELLNDDCYMLANYYAKYRNEE